MRKVLVIGETADEKSVQQTGELIAAARDISGQEEISAAFFGPPGFKTPAISTDRIYVIEHESLGDPDAATFDAATDALTALAKETSSDVILFAKSDGGSVIAPRIAARLGATYAADCTSIEASETELTLTRPVHGGNANAFYRISGGGPCVISIRPGSYEPDPLASDTSEPVAFDATPHIGESRSTLIRTVQEAHEGVRLEDAEVVVSGGRGLGGPEPFTQIQELANLLNGAVGASRAACDAGWIDHSHQVGLTGKTVSPRLYLSFGISGASQHMAGCSSARNIVAINTDPDASIFGDARFGVVGDWKKVLPALISAVRDIS